MRIQGNPLISWVYLAPSNRFRINEKLRKLRPHSSDAQLLRAAWHPPACSVTKTPGPTLIYVARWTVTRESCAGNRCPVHLPSGVARRGGIVKGRNAGKAQDSHSRRRLRRRVRGSGVGEKLRT